METTVKLKLGFAALMIVSGIGVAMYPVVSNAVAQRHASSVIESYNDTVQSMDAEKIDAAKEAARRYNQQLNNAIDRDAAGSGRHRHKLCGHAGRGREPWLHYHTQN